jgi:hypothetical protein
MDRVGFEPATPAFERATRVRGSDRTATVNGRYVIAPLH